MRGSAGRGDDGNGRSARSGCGRELVSLPVALERLRGTSCFLTEDLIENALERDAARRRT